MYFFNIGSKLSLALDAKDLIQGEAINLARQRKYKFYGMREVCEINSWLARFKNKLGCDSKPINHYYFSSNESPGDKSLDIVNDIKNLNLIRQKLPLNITKALGYFIKRYL